MHKDLQKYAGTRPSLARLVLLTPGSRPLTSTPATNEAGIVLTAGHLRIYVGNSVGAGLGRPRHRVANHFGLAIRGGLTPPGAVSGDLETGSNPLTDCPFR
jgi:hypothetical protein